MINMDTLLQEIASLCKCHLEEIEWYSWPHVFPTTGGPKGMGGSIPSPFQIYAFNTPTKKIKYCNGVWRRWNGEFNSNW